ncbi:MFS general substrate transporter [Polyplosphaeria fusca]|uniref:MFS general substrate transporter n=1 Tax=Polyplosphaeria fusca TaxID=682080 RepID=A0A9P4V0U0_9PLEO|nr:MFS general substrate transporter [Polyplosphaeria fusca]
MTSTSAGREGRVRDTAALDRISPSPSPRHLSPGPATLGDRSLPVDTSQRATGPRQTIDNPLLTFDDTVARTATGRTELEEYVLQFARQADIEDRYNLLVFGARLARDKYEAMTRYDAELTDPEKDLIENENNSKTGFWKQSKFFKATIITASLGGMIQGWTQSANNGTITGMPEEFGLRIQKNATTQDLRKFGMLNAIPLLSGGLFGTTLADPLSANNGTITGMPEEFGLRIQQNVTTQDLWKFGMLNAIPLLSGGLFGTTLADPLQENYLGRRGSIMVSACITIATTIGASTTHTVGQLAACRALNGLALGAKASIVPIYSAEISPEHIRGAILANWQLADALGIFFGFMCNLIIISYLGDKPNTAWRIMTNTVLIPTVPLLAMIYLMPESPRYLMKHGKYRRALESFTMIQTTPLLASRDFMYTHAQLDFESRLMTGSKDERADLAARIERSEVDLSRGIASSSAHSNGHHPNSSNRLGISGGHPRDSHQQSSSETQSHDRGIELNQMSRGDDASDTSSIDIEAIINRKRRKDNPYAYHIGVTGYFKRVAELGTNKRCRRALYAAAVAMIAQQMTGVNTIAVLGTTVWENSLGSSTNSQIDATIGIVFGAANYIAGIPAYWFSDKYGRSIMLAIGLPNMAWSMLVFAFLFKINDDAAKIVMISIFAVIFVVFYAPTGGTSPFSISAEVFPLVSREAGMAVSVAVNLLGAGILVLVFPMLLHSIGPTGSLSIFAGLNVIAFFMVYLLVPETRRRTIEELQFTFDLSTRWHIEYRAVYIRKHFTKNFWKYLTRKPVRPPIPFYRWARITHGERAVEE